MRKLQATPQERRSFDRRPSAVLGVGGEVRHGERDGHRLSGRGRDDEQAEMDPAGDGQLVLYVHSMSRVLLFVK